MYLNLYLGTGITKKSNAHPKRKIFTRLFLSIWLTLEEETKKYGLAVKITGT
jgi:hypothetical protein